MEGSSLGPWAADPDDNTTAFQGIFSGPKSQSTQSLGTAATKVAAPLSAIVWEPQQPAAPAPMQQTIAFRPSTGRSRLQRAQSGQQTLARDAGGKADGMYSRSLMRAESDPYFSLRSAQIAAHSLRMKGPASGSVWGRDAFGWSPAQPHEEQHSAPGKPIGMHWITLKSAPQLIDGLSKQGILCAGNLEATEGLSASLASLGDDVRPQLPDEVRHRALEVPGDMLGSQATALRSSSRSASSSSRSIASRPSTVSSSSSSSSSASSSEVQPLVEQPPVIWPGWKQEVVPSIMMGQAVDPQSSLRRNSWGGRTAQPTNDAAELRRRSHDLIKPSRPGSNAFAEGQGRGTLLRETNPLSVPEPSEHWTPPTSNMVRQSFSGSARASEAVELGPAQQSSATFLRWVSEQSSSSSRASSLQRASLYPGRRSRSNGDSASLDEATSTATDNTSQADSAALGQQELSHARTTSDNSIDGSSSAIAEPEKSASSSSTSPRSTISSQPDSDKGQTNQDARSEDKVASEHAFQALGWPNAHQRHSEKQPLSTTAGSVASQQPPRLRIPERSKPFGQLHSKSGSKTSRELYLETVRRARRGHSRPSPTPQDPEQKAQARVKEQMRIPVNLWTVAQVADWVAVLGLPQYKKRFIHQRISGTLLLRLSHRLLKAELGIGVMGHREALLEGIRALPHSPGDQATSSTMHLPTSLESPGSPVLRAKAHRTKLLRELEKAQAHAAALKSKLQGTAHQKELAEEDIVHIRGAITELETSFQLRPTEAALGKTNGGRSGVDTRGTIPWHPNGAPFELTAVKAERAAREERPGSGSKLLNRTRHHEAPFLERMNRDLKEREHRLEEMRRQRDSPTARFDDPDYPSKRQKADMEAVKSFVSRCLGLSLADIREGHIPLQTLRKSGGSGSSLRFRRAEAPHPHGASQQSGSNADPDGDHHIEDVSRSASQGLREADSVPIMGLQSLAEADLAAQTSLQAVTGSDGNAGEANAHDRRPIIGLTPVAPLDTNAAPQEEDAAATARENSFSLTSREDTSAASDSRVNGGTRPSQTSSRRPASLGTILDALADQCAVRRFLTPSQGRQITEAKLEAVKLHRFASAAREAQFMQRYQKDAQSRTQRRVELKNRWHAIETQPAKPPDGRLQRFWRPQPSTAEKEATELDTCRHLFMQAGWPVEDFLNSNSAGAAEKLDSVLARAQAAISEERLQTSQGRSTDPPEFEDGLDDLQSSFAAQKAESASQAATEQLRSSTSTAGRATGVFEPTGSAAAKAARLRTASAGSSAYFSQAGAPGKGTMKQWTGALFRESRLPSTYPGGGASIARRAREQMLPRDAPANDVLGSVVKQLAKCHTDELASLQRIPGPKKLLGVYRALVKQRFLHDLEVDKANRSRKAQEALQALQPQRKKLTAEEAHAFFERLLVDAARRQMSRDMAVSAAREAELSRMDAARKQLAQELHYSGVKSSRTSMIAARSRPHSSAIQSPARNSCAFGQRPASAKPRM